MDGKFIYLDPNNKILGKYIGNDEIVHIPDNTEMIEDAAFASTYSLKKVFFPKTLKEIGRLAFYNCVNLVETNLDDVTCDKAEDSFVGCVKLKKAEYLLKEITVAEIEKGLLPTFYVKDYQRGYRWTANEIEELLNDIKETTRRYCLQPLIVKESVVEAYGQMLDESGLSKNEMNVVINKPAYELIDGQQRLTTLLLILNECAQRSKSPAPAPRYTIFYELYRSIDLAYIEKAKVTTKAWFDKNQDVSAQEFANKIRKNVFFIWYEMKTDGTVAVEKEFRNINDGQTPLTNSELFKAMLLNPENAESSNETLREDLHARLVQIAYEWDAIEQALHSEPFWFFIANKECRDQTHLDYLFELYSIRLSWRTAGKGSNGVPLQMFNDFKAKLDSLDKERDRFSFLAIKEYMDYLCKANKISKFVSIVTIWEEIVSQYHRLYSWFSDSELYHNIGYLVSVEKKTAGNSIVPLVIAKLFWEGFSESFSDTPPSQRHKVKSLEDLKKNTREKIREHLKKQLISENKGITVFSDQYYMRGNRDVRDFLLYVNVWATAKANERFPFHRFKNTKDPKGRTVSWDIEHVSAKNLKLKIEQNELKIIRPWWKEEEKAMGYDVNSAERTWDANEWERFAKKVNDEEQPDNSISNLVLLDCNTNRSYGDDLFFGKRQKIIERDKNNSYIPICTKNVFLKYYTAVPDTAAAWTESDKRGYMSVILDCIEHGIYQGNVPKTVCESIEKEKKKITEGEK